MPPQTAPCRGDLHPLSNDGLPGERGREPALQVGVQAGQAAVRFEFLGPGIERVIGIVDPVQVEHEPLSPEDRYLKDL
jgi:hypothetical protein